MRLEGVIVCVDYADYLAETLPLNLRHFDRLVIVTAPEDRDTQRIARYYGVPHIQTDVFRSRWGEFHKAKGINLGLAQLAEDDWTLHMDADIVLPPKTRELIERAELNKHKLYGCDRFNVPGHDAWRSHQAMPALQQDNYHVHLDIFPLAPRFAGQRMGGYAPPGFFQMWNQDGLRKMRNLSASEPPLRYPEDHNDASRTDVLFTANWLRRGREMLPEFVAYHLMSTAADQGANWGGRTTPRWGAEPVEDQHHPRFHRDPPTHAEFSQPDGHWRPRPDPHHHGHHHGHHHHHHHRPPYGRGPEQDQSNGGESNGD